MKYLVEIELGNDEMQEPWQVGQALYALGESLANDTEWHTRNIRDYNGNLVGVGHIDKEGN